MITWFPKYQCSQSWEHRFVYHMMTSSNGNIFLFTGPLCGEFTGHRLIPLTKASDAELWLFLWSASEQTVSKQSRRRWFATPSCSLLRHCNVRYESTKNCSYMYYENKTDAISYALHSCYDADFVVAGGTACFYYDYLCHQWRRIWHHGDSWISVIFIALGLLIVCMWLYNFLFQVICYKFRCHPTYVKNYHDENNDHVTSNSIPNWREDVYAFHWTHPNPREYANETTLVNSKGMFAEIGQFVLKSAGLL